jgi:hypothetical protein
MPLPNGERARIDPKKISGYLLSVTHPVGRHKWRFFQSLGFSPDDLSRLDGVLRGLARTATVVHETATPYGIRYIVAGLFTAPNGTTAALRTVWIVETGRTEPRFVTAFPRRPGRGDP